VTIERAVHKETMKKKQEKKRKRGDNDDNSSSGSSDTDQPPEKVRPTLNSLLYLYVFTYNWFYLYCYAFKSILVDLVGNTSQLKQLPRRAYLWHL
jgi:hypothetical protein